MMLLIYNLKCQSISISPKCAAQFEKYTAELAPTGAVFRVLCPNLGWHHEVYDRQFI